MDELSRLIENDDVELFKIGISEIPPTHKWAIMSFFDSAFSGKLEFVKFLLEFGVDPTSKHFESDCTAFLVAAQEGNLDILKYLYEKTGLMNPNEQDKNGVTPIFAASRAFHKDVVEYLLSIGADPNICSKDGSTALFACAIRSYLEIMKLLVEFGGCDVNKRKNNGTTALWVAADLGCFEIVKYLLSVGADPNLSRFSDKKTPLHIAAEKNYHEIFKAIHSSGGDLKISDQNGKDCFYLASSFGSIEIMEYLLNVVGIEINGIPKLNPLFAAFEFGELQSAKWLISKGAKLNASEIPLIVIAIQHHYNFMIDFLKDANERLSRLKNALRMCRLFSSNKRNPLFLGKIETFRLVVSEILGSKFGAKEKSILIQQLQNPKTMNKFQNIPLLISQYLSAIYQLKRN